MVNWARKLLSTFLELWWLLVLENGMWCRSCLVDLFTTKISYLYVYKGSQNTNCFKSSRDQQDNWSHFVQIVHVLSTRCDSKGFFRFSQIVSNISHCIVCWTILTNHQIEFDRCFSGSSKRPQEMAREILNFKAAQYFFKNILNLNCLQVHLSYILETLQWQCKRG